MELLPVQLESKSYFLAQDVCLPTSYLLQLPINRMWQCILIAQGAPLLSLEMWESRSTVGRCCWWDSTTNFPSFSISMVGPGLGWFLHISANKPYRRRPEFVQAETHGKIFIMLYKSWLADEIICWTFLQKSTRLSFQSMPISSHEFFFCVDVWFCVGLILSILWGICIINSEKEEIS